MSYVYSGKLQFNIVFRTMTGTGPVYDVTVEHPTIGQVFKGPVAMTQKEEALSRKYGRLEEIIAEYVLDKVVGIQGYAERQFRSDGDGPHYRITKHRTRM
jgi:hypothetical protein